ncbi:MAG: hypothetical protein QG659_81 [Patescibacteria group bacterium]|jgi:hypothetical protein|nr:hypothetical protein [Patescibacteria group bacterium]
MTKPKKITVKYIASSNKTTVKKDDAIKDAVLNKQAETEACPFC